MTGFNKLRERRGDGSFRWEQNCVITPLGLGNKIK
jgi:hypothetical protein